MSSSGSMSFLIPTRFIWRFGGAQVHLCGSFTRWVETVPMHPVEGQPGVFTVLVHLPQGYHQYKFIVDGEWRHDETQPFMPDPLGNVNNWLFVRRGDLDHQGQSAQGQGQQDASMRGEAGAAGQAPPVPSLPPQEDLGMEMEEGEEEDDGASERGVVVMPENEPEATKRKILDFLNSHTAYELIPESGKAVLLDTRLPVRQAFHALHDQGVTSAPLWDSEAHSMAGMISASDFISLLQQMRQTASANGNPLSDAQIDSFTIVDFREQCAASGTPPRDLVFVKPQDTLRVVVETLLCSGCSCAPILTNDPQSASSTGKICELLHVATLSGVLACLMRHFRASLASLPLLNAQIIEVPLGAWVASSLAGDGKELPEITGPRPKGQVGGRTVLEALYTVHPNTPVTKALGLLLEKGVSALPVQDDKGQLLDIYTRADITLLAKGNAYTQLQHADVTVAQVLALSQILSPPAAAAGGSKKPVGPGGLSQAMAGQQGAQRFHIVGGGAPGQTPQPKQRVFTCTSRDTLRSVVEKLSVPGVRRLIVMDPETREAEGVISLSDVAAFILM